MLAALATLVSVISLAGAQDRPAHGHVRLLHAVYSGSGPDTVLESYQQCVDLGDGQHLARHAHPDDFHVGRAGHAQHEAGHRVVPTAPFGPVENCAELASLIPPGR